LSVSKCSLLTLGANAGTGVAEDSMGIELERSVSVSGGDAFVRVEPAIEPGLAEGDFAPLLAWLAANVHGLGSSIDMHEMLARATGRGLETQAYIAHLTARYLT